MVCKKSTTPSGPGFLLNFWHIIGLVFWQILFRVLNRVDVIDSKNIASPDEAGVIYLYNHRSAIDPFVVPAVAMPYFSSIWWRAPAKEELHRIPIVKSIIESWGAFPVRRGKRDFEAIKNMVSMLRNSVLLISPEGRRSTNGKLLPGRPGVGKIIHDARPNKVIPVAISGVEHILPKGRIIPKIGKKTRIVFGKPLNFEAYYERECSVALSQEIIDLAMAAIDQMLHPKRSYQRSEGSLDQKRTHRK